LTSEEANLSPHPGWGGVLRAVGPVYGIWLLPAVVGVVLDWPWWIGLVLLIPGLCWYAFTEGTRRYKQIRSASPASPVGIRVPLLAALPLLVGVSWNQSRYASLFMAGGLIFVDLTSRVHRRSGSGGRVSEL
jgi:hypothetical protein